MPRRSSNKSSSPVPRRQSARIAAASANKSSSPSPVKKTRRTSKRDASKKAEKIDDSVDHNGTESSSKEASCIEEPPEKKAKIESQEPAEKSSETSNKSPKKEESETNDAAAPKASDEAKEAGFEVVEKSDAPEPGSDEVKEAIAAQGEDGQLLVNYVQVTKDDVADQEAATSGDKPPSNGTDTKEASNTDTAVVEAAGENPTAADSESKKEETPAEKPTAAATEEASH